MPYFTGIYEKRVSENLLSLKMSVCFLSKNPVDYSKTQWVIWKPKKPDNDNVNDNKYIGAAAKASLLELL